MLGNNFFFLEIVHGVTGIEPVADRIDIQIGDFGDVGPLDQHLLFRDKGRDEVGFLVIKMENTLVEVAVHVGIGEEDLGRAGFQDQVQDLGLLQLIHGLGGQDHGAVLLSPGLECPGDVVLDGGIFEEHPGLVDDESFENPGKLVVLDDGIGPVEQVKQQGLDELRIPLHPFELDALEPGKSECVFGIVKEEPELSILGPLVQGLFQGVRKRVLQGRESAQAGINGVDHLDLLEEISLLLVGQVMLPAVMDQQ